MITLGIARPIGGGAFPGFGDSAKPKNLLLTITGGWPYLGLFSPFAKSRAHRTRWRSDRIGIFGALSKNGIFRSLYLRHIHGFGHFKDRHASPGIPTPRCARKNRRFAAVSSRPKNRVARPRTAGAAGESAVSVPTAIGSTMAMYVNYMMSARLPRVPGHRGRLHTWQSRRTR